MKKICGLIGKYSYAIFLTHHFLIYKISSKFDLGQITRTNSHILFFVCFIIIIVSAYLVTFLYNRFQEGIFDIFYNEKKYREEKN